jgi:hypothetical protein
MTTWAVLATGKSLNAESVEAVRHLPAVAVSDAYKLAPWAIALASADFAWWKHHEQAQRFKGKKFTAAPDWQGMHELRRIPGVSSGINSGLLGLRVAVELGAKRVLLLGFDMQGDHFFGKHPTPLKNPDERRFQVFKNQFMSYRPRGVEIINCNLESGLDVYPKASLADCLAQSTV